MVGFAAFRLRRFLNEGNRHIQDAIYPHHWVQGFNWESSKQNWWGHVEERAEYIAECGITTVWLPPPSDSVSKEGYM